jgi:hypothetical protein
MRLIERTARWADPETFHLLPVWYPEFARGVYFYKANWSAPQQNKNRRTKVVVHKQEGNRYANQALTHALGLRSDDRPNWSCCHIWSVDDARFQEANAIVQDRRYYSCIANMLLLPAPLKAFTDVMKEVKAMLRICARYVYGWHCDHETMRQNLRTIDAWSDWSAYPKSWPSPDRPTAKPQGIRKIDDKIRQGAARRLAQIRTDLDKAGEHYPREEVRSALAYWGIEV